VPAVEAPNDERHDYAGDNLDELPKEPAGNPVDKGHLLGQHGLEHRRLVPLVVKPEACLANDVGEEAVPEGVGKPGGRVEEGQVLHVDDGKPSEPDAHKNDHPEVEVHTELVPGVEHYGQEGVGKNEAKDRKDAALAHTSQGPQGIEVPALPPVRLEELFDDVPAGDSFLGRGAFLQLVLSRFVDLVGCLFQLVGGNLALGGRDGLEVDHVGVDPVEGQELLVVSLLDDGTLVKHENPVGVPDC